MVPIVILDADDRQSLEYAIIENVQRSDLNALEEAFGYEKLTQEFSYNQADIAKIIGKSRSHVTNTLRLLKLPEGAKKFVIDGSISAGHARALLSVPNPEKVAQQIVDEGLTVRDVERLVQARRLLRKLKRPRLKRKTTQIRKRSKDYFGLARFKR